jgi:hypothetical protein
VIIEGGFPEHRRLLAEIVGGLGEPQFAHFRLEQHTPQFSDEVGEEQRRAASGVQLTAVGDEEPTLRGRWELRLAADALKDRAALEGLEAVVWEQDPRGGGRLSDSPAVLPLEADEVERLHAGLSEAVVSSGAAVDAVEVLRPFGHALALRLAVDEPHTFLRLRYRELGTRLEPWLKTCGGQWLLEIVDTHDEPALGLACTRNTCSGGVRSDVACCDPLVWPSRGLFYRRPPCPVFD